MSFLGKFEPVITGAILIELIGAVLTALVAFNIPVTADQRGAILGLAAALGAIFFGGAVLMRNSVYSPASVETMTGQLNPQVVPLTPEARSLARGNG